jgi:hypothetical protein
MRRPLKKKPIIPAIYAKIMGWIFFPGYAQKAPAVKISQPHSCAPSIPSGCPILAT